MNQIPDSSNLFGSIKGPIDKADVAPLFEANGWTSRKCSKTDFEVICPFAELVIEGYDSVLIHGPVSDILRNSERIAAVLANSTQPYSLEIYDGDETLLKKVESQGA